MNSGRFFVTAVVLLATLPACSKFKAAREGNASLTQEQVKTGADLLDQANALELEIGQKYKIDLKNPALPLSELEKMSEEDRAQLKEKLYQYQSKANAVLALDARHGYYLYKKEIVIGKCNSAAKLQQSILDFEGSKGERYDPKGGFRKGSIGQALEV
jgi:hypothetical protein